MADFKRMSKRIDALSADGKVNMRSVILTLWREQSNPDLIAAITDLLKENSSSKSFCEEMEFYLPQLVHLMLHLPLGEQVLQELIFCVCQTSIHFGIQLFFLVQGLLQDYQIEDEEGNKNPTGDAELYLRCSNLLYSLERAIVFNDSPEVAQLQADFNRGTITKAELDKGIREARSAHSKKVVEIGKDEPAVLEGELLYKRWTKTGALKAMKTKGWKTRRFVLKHRLLLCYRTGANGILKRAIPLYNCDIKEPKHRLKEHYFEVIEKGTDRVYKLAASNEATKNQWIKELTKAGQQPPLLEIANSDKLTEQQNARFHFFKNEIDFVRLLTDICERMRFQDRIKRKPILKREMLKLGKDLTDMGTDLGIYIPLVKSTDKYVGVLEPLPNACHPFSTKERCPCLMSFKVALPDMGENAEVDVANYLHDRFADEGDAHVGEKLKQLVGGQVSRASQWTEEEVVTSMSKTNIPHEEGTLKLIAKSNDDLRQEVFVMQMISFLKQIWEEAGLDLWLYPYTILSTSKNTGLLQLVEDANSFDGIKSDYWKDGEGEVVTLMEHFKRQFPDEDELQKARERYALSLAGYSAVCYILSIKDRHNGNIMLRSDGRIVHIDFGFVLGQAPGKDKVPHVNASWERAAFKLTSEMVEVIPDWDKFVNNVIDGVNVARRPEHLNTIITLLEVTGYKSLYPCFNQPGGGVKRCVRELKARLFAGMKEEKASDLMKKKILHAKTSKLTKGYEWFQLKTNGIRPIY